MNITEKNKQCGKDQTNSDIKEQQKNNRIKQHNELPGKGDMVQYAENEEYTQRQAKVDQSLGIAAEKKEIFRNIDFCKNRGICHQGAHALRS